MKTILITDTHYGTRQNSINWLNSQCKFIYEQLIPYIKECNEEVKLIHLGDVFDSRSTISTMVADKVIHMFKDLSEIVKDFIIIAGNHDYYSPNSDSLNTIDLLFDHLNIKLVTKSVVIDNKNIYIPWYKWIEEPQMIQDLINTHGIENAFTHADIVNEPVNIYCRHIYSGHIHIPYCKGNIRNLGSTYPLNFADANTPRGFYVIHDDNVLEFIENVKSIRFHRLYNEDIFTMDNMNELDYIELYINQTNLSNQRYINQINFISKKWKNVWIIPQVELIESEIQDVQFSGYDIESITKEMIPNHLLDKFNIILKNL